MISYIILIIIINYWNDLVYSNKNLINFSSLSLLLLLLLLLKFAINKYF